MLQICLIDSINIEHVLHLVSHCRPVDIGNRKVEPVCISSIKCFSFSTQCVWPLKKSESSGGSIGANTCCFQAGRSRPTPKTTMIYNKVILCHTNWKLKDVESYERRWKLWKLCLLACLACHVHVGKHHVLHNVSPSRCQIRPERLKCLQLHSSHMASIINNDIDWWHGLNQLIPKLWIFLISNPYGCSVIFKFACRTCA